MNLKVQKLIKFFYLIACEHLNCHTDRPDNSKTTSQASNVSRLLLAMFERAY